MKEKEFDNYIREAMKYEDKKLQEIINNEPSLAEVKAPDDLHDRLFAQIREYEEERARLKEKEELDNLKKRYKRAKRWNKIVILVAALVCLMALGVTSMGGPKRVLEEFKRTIGGREQTYVNNDDGSNRTGEMEIVSEAEAYEEIDSKYNISPIKLFFLPEGMEFVEVVIEDATQNARLYYEQGKEKMLCYTIWFDYRLATTGIEKEEQLVDEYSMNIEGVVVAMKQYFIEESGTDRWYAEFQHQDVRYTILMNGFSKEEAEKVVENLYFFE